MPGPHGHAEARLMCDTLRMDGHVWHACPACDVFCYTQHAAGAHCTVETSRRRSATILAASEDDKAALLSYQHDPGNDDRCATLDALSRATIIQAVRKP